MPELLRRFESALALRISLFRFMIGVSAKGNAIFVTLSSSSGAGAGVSCWVWRFFFTVTGRNPGLGERSGLAWDWSRDALCGDGDLISWKARFDRRPVFGAALSSGLVGNFALGFLCVFGASSSFGAGPGFGAFDFAVCGADFAAGSGALGAFSVFEFLLAGFLLGFARFVNSKSPSLLS
jgi:hypothetical protein